jgi:hypothetical protein
MFIHDFICEPVKSRLQATRGTVIVYVPETYRSDHPSTCCKCQCHENFRLRFFSYQELLLTLVDMSRKNFKSFKYSWSYHVCRRFAMYDIFVFNT